MKPEAKDVEAEYAAAGKFFGVVYKRFLAAEQECARFREELLKNGKEPKEVLAYRLKRRHVARLARVYIRAGDRSLALAKICKESK